MKKTRSFAVPALLMLGLSGCGGDKSSSTPVAPLPPLQASFTEAAATYQIPKDILLAVVFKESGFSAHASQTTYDSGDLKGPSLTQTAMGVSRATLGLDASEASDELKTQLDAYGSWIKAKLGEEHIELPANFNKADDVYDWAWQLARMHFPKSSKNLQILFVLELLKTLNDGFIWQDPDSDERLELAPRSPRLEISSFSETVQANLQLDLRDSDLSYAQYLQLNYVAETPLENRPGKIRVIHCPFSLSTCLGTQMQNTAEAGVSLEAHYIIPPEGSVLSNPIKILQHRSPVTLQASSGATELVSDAIVVMLVGNSGRIVNGERTQTNPSWYSVTQLKRLGEMVSGICQLMIRDNPLLNLQNCMTPGTGVLFADPAPHAQFLFGDIPDYDSSIFGSLIANPSGMSGEVKIQFSGSQKLFAAGSSIPVNFSFIKGTAKLEVQRLERCTSGKTVWTTLQTLFLRSVDQKNIELNLFDQGPNKNGQQFIRALAYNNDGLLMGWAVKDLFLSNFDRENQPGPNLTQCKE